MNVYLRRRLLLTPIFDMRAWLRGCSSFARCTAHAAHPPLVPNREPREVVQAHDLINGVGCKWCLSPASGLLAAAAGPRSDVLMQDEASEMHLLAGEDIDAGAEVRAGGRHAA